MMKTPKKIILIVVDSLRADHLGCYGYKRNTSPTIDEIAKENILFKWCFSTISYTVPSFTSLLTSLYPSDHSIGFHHKFPKLDKDKDILLPEILKSLDYSTAAILGSMALRKEIGLDAGFDVYDDPDWRSAQNSNEKLFSWLDDNHDKDFFAMMHYFDAHIPYKPPTPYDKEFVGDAYYGKSKHLNVKLDGWLDEEIQIGGIPKSSILSNDGKVETDVRYYISQYDGCIKYIDNAIAKVVEKLKKLNIYDDCLLIITADHGDAMGENDVWFFHGYTVTPDVIHVPLIMKLPKECEWVTGNDNVVDVHVSHIDLMPTILDMLEYDTEGLPLQGKSLLKLVKEGFDENFEKRIINAEIQGQIANIDKNTMNIKPKEIDKDNIILFHVEKLCKKEITYNYRDEYIKTGFIGKLRDQLSDIRSRFP